MHAHVVSGTIQHTLTGWHAKGKNLFFLDTLNLAGRKLGGGLCKLMEQK
jgi:hypothetical protein